MKWNCICFSTEKLYGMYTQKRPCRVWVDSQTFLLASWWMKKPLFRCEQGKIFKIREVITLGNRYFIFSAAGNGGEFVLSLRKKDEISFREWCRNTLGERFLEL